jgi:hypothetical protein
MHRWGVALLIVIGTLGACAPAAPTSTAQPTSRFATIEGPIAQQTLPPAWTPSDTPTRTPTRTATPIPSATPTLTAADICDGFDLMHDFTAQRVYAWESFIPIIISLSAPDATIHFAATHQQTGLGNGFDMPGGQAIAVEFQISALPQPGTYDWQLSVQHPVYGDLCQREGRFIALRPRPTPAPTSEATAEVTEPVE